MPLFEEFHGHFWGGPSTEAPPPQSTVIAFGYPAWQASVVAPSLFGALGAWWDHVVDFARWWWRFGLRVHRLNAEQRILLLHVLSTLESTLWPSAKLAVRETATILGFREPTVWKKIWMGLRDNPGLADNAARHVEACRRFRAQLAQLSSTATHAQEQLIVELAYHDFVLHPHKETMQA